MIRGFLNFLAFGSFVLFLPVFCLLAWGWGSEDERFLMKAALCTLGPFCAVMWYILMSHLVFRRKSSYLVQFVILVAGYGGIFLLLRSGVIAF
jgi:hypothetical protein